MSGKYKKIIFYTGIYTLFSVFLVKVLYREIAGSFFDMDLLWFIPTVIDFIKNTSGYKLLSFLFTPFSTMYGVPTLKLYSFFVLSLFGPIAKYFILTSFVIHFGCSITLFFVTRRLGLNNEISFFSALTYLVLFAHFGAYMWPMASQHLIATFFILLVLNLYIKTNKLMDSGRKYHAYYALTLIANLAASLCRISVVILPLMILTHILVCAKDYRERIRKYYLWIPLFITYLFYPLIKLTYVGEGGIEVYLSTGSNPNTAYLLFLAIGIISMVSFGAVLLLFKRIAYLNRLKLILLITVALSIYAWLSFINVRNIVLPYNALVPFMGIFMSFLEPLKNALLNNSARPYYFIYLNLSAFSFLLSIFFIAVFLKEIALKHKGLFVLIPWYILSVVYLNLRNPIPSRYFIYLSPIFCIVFCSVLVQGFRMISNKMNLKTRAGGAILILIFVFLLVPNAVAIGLDFARGRLANNFLVYNYIRIAGVIKEDMLAGKKALDKQNPKALYIDNVSKIPSEDWRFSSLKPGRYDNFKFVLAETFDDVSMMQVNVNKKPSGARYFYKIDNTKIINKSGDNIDIFTNFFDEGLTELKNGNYKKARGLIQKALKKRPFLLNFILRRLDLEDSKWITGMADINTWVDKIIRYHKTETRKKDEDKINHIASVVQNEINGYIQCLFLASYLEFISGNIEKSKYLFSQIQFLESDYDKVYSELSEIPFIKSDNTMMDFLKKFNKLSLYTDVAYRNRYEFERFLVKFVFDKK